MTTTQSTEPACFCRICSGTAGDAAPTATEPSGTGGFAERDRRIADNVTQYGWHVMGVGGGRPRVEWAYSIGLWHTRRSPEVCVFGLPTETAMRMVNVVAASTEQHPLAPDQRRDDVLDGYQVAVRPVHPSWYPSFFGAGLDFQQQPPWPLAQIVWPDQQGRLPFEEGAAEECRTGQPPLWLPKDTVGGAWAAHDPLDGWPFGSTLPHATVLASPGVADGSAPPVRVERDAEGGWRFLAGGDGPEPQVYPLGLLLHTHPDLAAVGTLAPGASVDRAADGSWPAP